MMKSIWLKIFTLCFCFSLSSIAVANDSATNKKQVKNTTTEQFYPSVKSTEKMAWCGRGYVIGVWASADGWDTWVVWASENTQSYSAALKDNSLKTFRASDAFNLKTDAGRAAYAGVIAAMSNGQFVSFFDDTVDSDKKCRVSGVNEARGARFTSTEIWFR